MKRFYFLLTAMAFLFSNNARALEVGDKVEMDGVKVANHEGVEVDLGKELADGYTLVYFYPKADTPGCTKQGCSVRDNHEALAEKGIKTIGVSADKVEAQKKFSEKFSFNFPLLADTEGEVIKGFDVPTMPGMGFPKRQAFLVKEGVLVWKNEKVSPVKMVDEVLAFVGK
jgi:peroxiredoxin Q/BCP